MTMILEEIRVIDLSHWILGPEAAGLLGDLGADVFHVEQKGVGDQYRGVSHSAGVSMNLDQGRHVFFENINRNKRGIALDLKNPTAKDIMYRLVENSDVFISNLEMSSIKSLRLDYDTLRQINPKLIYAVGSGLGDQGPDAAVPSMDMTITARSGVMSLVGDGGESGSEPGNMVPGFADAMGGIMVAFGIIAALLARERHGMGQEVRVGALGGMMIPLRMQIGQYALTKTLMPRSPRTRPLSPTFSYYRCKDGAWIALGAMRDIEWEPLCQAMERTDLLSDPRFDNVVRRSQNAVELVPTLDEVFAAKTRGEWCDILKQAKITHSPVNTVPDLFSDPQVLENNFIHDYEHPALGNIQVIGSPWKFSETPVSIRRCAPEMGEHTEEILIEVGGYTWEDIIRFQEAGAI